MKKLKELYGKIPEIIKILMWMFLGVFLHGVLS